MGGNPTGFCQRLGRTPCHPLLASSPRALGRTHLVATHPVRPLLAADPPHPLPQLQLDALRQQMAAEVREGGWLAGGWSWSSPQWCLDPLVQRGGEGKTPPSCYQPAMLGWRWRRAIATCCCWQPARQPALSIHPTPALPTHPHTCPTPPPSPSPPSHTYAWSVRLQVSYLKEQLAVATAAAAAGETGRDAVLRWGRRLACVIHHCCQHRVARMLCLFFVVAPETRGNSGHVHLPQSPLVCCRFCAFASRIPPLSPTGRSKRRTTTWRRG